jgi:divalent metal cation (Fe/Co/Zn/Cd) transporter
MATLTDAHTLASQLEEDIRKAEPTIADIVVHTEPANPPASNPSSGRP